MDNKCINNFLDNANMSRRGALITLAGIATVVASGCAGLMPKPDFYPNEGDKHTLTYTDKTGKKNTVYDLSGKWETKYFSSREVVRIKQTGNEFVGYKTIGNTFVGKDTPTISGEVEGNLVTCRAHWDNGKITYATSKLTENADCFECEGLERRKYKKMD